jgi:hypothetical protein
LATETLQTTQQLRPMGWAFRGVTSGHFNSSNCSLCDLIVPSSALLMSRLLSYAQTKACLYRITHCLENFGTSDAPFPLLPARTGLPTASFTATSIVPPPLTHGNRWPLKYSSPIQRTFAIQQPEPQHLPRGSIQPVFSQPPRLVHISSPSCRWFAAAVD